MPRTCATHPAPERLLPEAVQRIFVSSTSVAAATCASGLTDGCLTTLRAALKHNLQVVTRFGRLPMAFTIHGPRERRALSFMPDDPFVGHHAFDSGNRTPLHGEL